MNRLNSVFFTDANTGTIVGASGTILRTTTGGATWVADGSELPQDFLLEQNYPNPSNPNTTIRHAPPGESFVRLTIYNILGQEVITLVDEEQIAGHHTARWEGINRKGERVSSEVYLYPLEAESMHGNQTFVHTRKMVLMR